MTTEERLAQLEKLVEQMVRTLGSLQDRFNAHVEEEESRSDQLIARLEREDDSLGNKLWQLESSLNSQISSLECQVSSLRYHSNR